MIRRVAVLMMLVAVAAFALLAASPAGALTKPTTIQVRAVATAPPLVTPDADGDGLAAAGDSFFLSARLVNTRRQLGRPRGATVGTGNVITWTFAPGLEIGLAAFKLRRGLIMASGVGSLARGSTSAVLGGTGIYDNVTGTARVRPVSPTTFLITIRLKPIRP